MIVCVRVVASIAEVLKIVTTSKYIQSSRKLFIALANLDLKLEEERGEEGKEGGRKEEREGGRKKGRREGGREGRRKGRRKK